MTAIKRIRTACGISQAEFATRLGVSQQTVSHWERGYKTPRADKLLKIAKLFNCTIDELLFNCTIDELLKNDGGTPAEEGRRND